MKKWITWLLALVLISLVAAVFWRPVVFWLYVSRSSWRHPYELERARRFCQQIITNESPTEEWLSSVDDSHGPFNKTNYFYALKVHFTECQTKERDIANARVLVFEQSPTNTAADFYYQRHAPYLQMHFRRVGDDQWKVRAIFPLNNCLFNPDVNKDGNVDQKDVVAAREQPE